MEGRAAREVDEDFAIIDSRFARWQLGRNLWEREYRCIASLDFAKREEIMPELLRAPDWDLVIIDEAHKCSAVSRWDPIEQRERLDRTRRYPRDATIASLLEVDGRLSGRPTGEPQLRRRAAEVREAGAPRIDWAVPRSDRRAGLPDI